MDLNRPPTPELYEMSAPHTEMNGKLIRVIDASGEAIGSLVCYHRPAEGKFGVRIDIPRTVSLDYGTTPPTDREWTDCGSITYAHICLNESQILAIRRAVNSEWEFELSSI